MNELVNSTQLKGICEQNGISYLGLFGSYARNEQTADSDVDLLVRFRSPVGYFTLVEVQNILEKLFKKDVDLVTENALSKYIKPKVIGGLKTIYGSR